MLIKSFLHWIKNICSQPSAICCCTYILVYLNCIGSQRTVWRVAKYLRGALAKNIIKLQITGRKGDKENRFAVFFEDKISSAKLIFSIVSHWNSKMFAFVNGIFWQLHFTSSFLERRIFLFYMKTFKLAQWFKAPVYYILLGNWQKLELLGVLS